MIFVIALAMAVTIGMPLWYAWRLWHLDEPSRRVWVATVAEAACVVALILVVGRWDIGGIHVRWVLAGLFAVAVLRSWRRCAHSQPAADARPWPLRFLPAAALACGLAYAIHGLVPPAGPDLAFPLADGRYVVGQGGSTRLLNQHAGHVEQGYAADITAVGAAGFRAAGLLPDDPSRYAIWGASVVSPCAGRVEQTRDGLPDLPPPLRDPENPAGNHVVIACNGLAVELAHLMQGSVTVAPGDALSPGDPIARVGNSGNTTEPHLHVHATDAATGQGVPVRFDGRAPVRNRVYVR